MGLAVQVGLLAAFIVVFLPLGMAGLHLTRNRLLFFSVALFITLAVSVHVAPYFPSFSSLLLPLKSQWTISGIRETFTKGLSGQSVCASLLHDMTWEDDNGREAEDYITSNRNLSDPCIFNRLWSWNSNASMETRKLAFSFWLFLITYSCRRSLFERSFSSATVITLFKGITSRWSSYGHLMLAISQA
ncbi:hypothetical protein GOP47_0030082 [Adiantum capillus-veneris]|nr:hypothetical protein GOP47_0030082 [Adiantum capillus-veneris]